MGVRIAVASLVLALATCTSSAQNVWVPPTRVCEVGLYGCPAHPDMQATWPARCPICQTVLQAVSPSASTRIAATPTGGQDDRRRGEEAREAQRDEELREQARRNEELRERARRNEELREQARRNEEWRGRYPYRGSYPPQGYVSPYPYNNYYYNPNTGQYEYGYPRYAYPYGEYYYDPNMPRYSYDPGTGSYYYDPNGRYYYSPYTGQYEYLNPGSMYPYR